MTAEVRVAPGASWRLARVALVAVAVALLLWAYAAALGVPSAGLFHDDGIYLVTARALAEGQGYRIISLPDAPPQTKYPILFPWLLSLVWQVAPPFPGNLPWLRLVPFLSALVWLWLSWRLIQQCGGSRAMATAIVLLTALAPWTLFLSTALLSETLFAALVTAALWALTASTSSVTWSTRLCAAAGLLSGAALLTRAAGVAIVVAALAWLISGRRWKHAVVFCVVAGAVAAPWALWVVARNSSVGETYYSASPYVSWNIVFSYSWPAKLDVVIRNVLYAAMTPSVLWTGAAGPLGLAVGLTVAVPLVLFGIWQGRHSVVAWCVGAMLTMNLMWVWPPARFIAPTVPLVLWLALGSLRGRARRIGIAIALLLGAAGARSSLEVATAARTMGSVWPSAANAEDWRQIAPLLNWIRDATPRNAVIAGNLDPAYYLFTGRVSVRAFEPDSYSLYYAPPGHTQPALGTLEDFRQRLLRARVDYCIWTPALGFGEAPHFRRLLDELAARFPGSLQVAAGEEATGYVVYAVDRSRLVDPAR